MWLLWPEPEAGRESVNGVAGTPQFLPVAQPITIEPPPQTQLQKSAVIGVKTVENLSLYSRSGRDIFPTMASKQKQQVKERTLEQVVAEIGLYPVDAYEFVQQGLSYTVQRIHGEEAEVTDRATGRIRSRHITGQDLCHGLREFALAQWGLLARAVLRRWNITCTLDFGRIVFALIEAGQMQKTDEDNIDDFRNVFDFKTAFESGYRIATASLACN
jgi:uncharacterized repeat protein (TIGR04138 family)